MVIAVQGYNSFSGDGLDSGDDEEEKAASNARPARQASKHPMARFNEATAPRLRGVVASGSESLTELGQELLDKAWLGDVAAIKHLVAVGADPNFVDREEGWGGVTPLINAATNGQKSAVMALLVLGAALEGRDENGWTALHRAAGKGHKSVVVALIEAGADVSARDSTGVLISCFRPTVLVVAATVMMRAENDEVVYYPVRTAKYLVSVCGFCSIQSSALRCSQFGPFQMSECAHGSGQEESTDAMRCRTTGLTAKDWSRFCGHEDLVDLLTPSEKSEHELLAELERLQVCVRVCVRSLSSNIYPCFVLASLTYKSDTIQAQLAARQTNKAAVAQPAAASSASPPSVASCNTPVQTPIADSSPGATKEVQEEEMLQEEKMLHEENVEKEPVLEKATVAASGGRDDQQEEPEPRPEVQHETQGAERKKLGNKKGKGNTAPSNGAQV